MSTVVKKARKPTIKRQFRLIDFHIYDEVNEQDESESEEDVPCRRDNKEFIIQIFGINEKGETCCIFVNDYTPFFYIRVGDNWNKSTVNNMVDHLVSLLGGSGEYYQDSLISYDLVDHHKLYGFSGGGKHKFVKMTFKNTIAMNKFKNIWYSYKESKYLVDGKKQNERIRKNIRFNNVDLELYESNIPPLLRYFHINNISPSGWVSINTSRVQTTTVKTTTCKYEYIASCTHVVSLPEKETVVPYKICSFDIEASSSHGDFPLPVKTYKRLTTQLVDIFLTQLKYIDQESGELLLKKIIRAGFGYGKVEDIDVVYPKLPPSESKVNKIIENLLTKSLDKAKKETEENNNDLIKLDEWIESMKDNHQSNSEGTLDANGEKVDHSQNAEFSYKKKYEKKSKINKTTTIMDILVEEQYDRDDKIKFIDEALTLVCPRLKGDEITFIGSTFLKYGEKEPYLNHCLVVNSCDNVEGAVIETVNTERELLLKWTKLIQQEDPDIIIGYNIFGFDYEFMFRRSLENHCHNDFLMLSRKLDDVCITEDRNDPTNLNLQHTKIQLASGEYDLRYVKMIGRLQVDMYAYFRRDFNLSSYKLDDVAGQFISDSVKKIKNIEHATYGDCMELYSHNLMGLHTGDFIHIEITGFTSDYYDNGKKFKVLDIEYGRDEEEEKYNVILIAGHYEIDNTKSIKWGMAKDDVSPQDIFRLTDGDSADRAIVAKYCIQDCNLVHHLMNKIDVLTGYIEMSRICSVPISFLVFRGQGIKLTSFVAKKCRDKDTLMPDVEKPKEAEGYEGAIVLPPKCSMYMDNPVACVDYSSLYPSSMISQNYSHDSKVWSKEYDLQGTLINIQGETNAKGDFLYDNLPDYQYIDIEFDTYKYIRKNPTSKAEKTKVGKMICRWAQFPDNKKGIMPSILEELLKARKDTRKMIKTEKDPFMQNILDKRQLGYKVTANSLYGQCGSRTSTFYEKDVAASTTATGRMMIIYARRMIEEVYGDREYQSETNGLVRTKAEYIYGDTDSVFFTFNLEDPKTGKKITGKPALETTIEIAQDAADLCTKYLKSPMKLEYEKTLMPFILLSKKRYVGILYEDDPNKGYLKFMGLSLKRRDSCDYLKDVYGGILNILMKENDIQSAIAFLQESLNELIKGNVSMEKLAITKALRGYYKNPQQIGHRVLADRIGQRDPGNKPKPGDRMKFVFIVNDKPKALMGDKIETLDYIKANNLQIDYTHYITNQLMKPLQQLFGLALEHIWTFQNKRSAINTYKKEMENLEKEFPDTEIFMKKKEKYCSAKVKILLFDKTLNTIYNEKHRIQTITTFFKKI